MDCVENTFDYSVDLPDGSFYLYFNCNGTTQTSFPLAFTNIVDAFAWVVDNWSIFGTWTANGMTLIVSDTLCMTGGLSFMFAQGAEPPPPPVNGIVLTNTNQDVDRMQKFLGAENMNFQNVNDISFFDIFDADFCANVDAGDWEGLEDSGTVPNKYLVRYAGDRPDTPPPTLLGGFNLTEHCAPGAGNSVDYSPISFWSNEVKWCLARGMKMLLNCNLNDYDLAAYTDNINYTDAQVGFVGLNVFQEYESPNSCNCSLCGGGFDAAKAAAVAAAANALIAGLGGLLTGKILTQDWKGINNPSSPLTDSYSNAVSIVNSTSIRIYCSETELMFQADYIAGRTGEEYLVSIDIAIDITFANRIPALIAITDKPVSITQLYSIGTGFSGLFLQDYFFARLIMKMILLEANTPNSIELAIFPRVDMFNLKGTYNNLYNVIILFNTFYTAGRKIYTMSLPLGMYGVASSSDGVHGTAMIINSTATPYDATSVNIASTELPIVSIHALHADGLMDADVYESVSSIGAFGIYECRF